MDLNNIKTFVCVAETGNVAKAAETLKYAQSTVTSQIHALEKEIGHPLFERIGRRNYLTDVGQEFLQYANDILYIMQKTAAIGQQSDDIHTTLRIGLLESLLFNHVLDLIPAFKTRYQNVHLSLKVTPAADALDLLQQNLLDMAYVSAALNTDPSLDCCYRKRERMVFVSGREHPCAGQKKIPLSEVLSYPFLVTEPSGHCYNTLLNLAATAGLPLTYSVMVNDIGAIVELLTDNNSVSFLPESSLSRYQNRYALTELDVDIPEQVYFSQILVRKNKWISPVMAHFISLIHHAVPED